MNHGSVGRSCYKTLTKEPEDSGVCKPHTYIASHADVLSGCGARTHDEPLLAVLFAECAYDMSGETAGGFFSRLFFSRLWFARVFALVFAASPLDLLPSQQTNRQLRTAV